MKKNYLSFDIADNIIIIIVVGLKVHLMIRYLRCTKNNKATIYIQRRHRG